MLAAQLGPALHVEHRLLLISVDKDRTRLTTTPDASTTAPTGSNLNRRRGVSFSPAPTEVTPGPLRRPPPRLAPLPRAFAPSSSGPRRGALRAGRLARAVLGRTFAAPYTARPVLTRRPALGGRAT